MQRKSTRPPISISFRQCEHTDEIRAALSKLASAGLFTDENKNLVVNHPEHAIDTAMILWHLQYSNKTLVNDTNRQHIAEFIKDTPAKLPEVVEKFNNLREEYKLTQEQFNKVIGSVKLKKEAFLTGTHPRLGKESSINKFFGTHEDKNGTRISNDELADPKLIGEIFKFL